MGKCPLVSIIVPAYNVENYIEEALQSVLSQTYQNWECIIVNDGSTDNTQRIAETWTIKDRRFRLINKHNGGLSRARNTGIEHSKGDILAFLDSDDVWLPHHLSILTEGLISKGVDLVFSSSYVFRLGVYTKSYANNLGRIYGNLYGNKALKLFLSGECNTNASFVVCTKKILVENGNFSFYKKAEDLHTWIKLLLNKARFYIFEEVTGYYRVVSNSMSSEDRICSREVLEIVFSFKKEIQNLGINYNYYFRLWARRYFLLKPTKKHYIETINYINSIDGKYFNTLKKVSIFIPEKILKLLVLQNLKLK